MGSCEGKGKNAKRKEEMREKVRTQNATETKGEIKWS